MKPERTRILLVVAPSKFECFKTVEAFALDMLHVGEMRFISNPYHLRGWSRATPFIAHNRQRWPETLDQVLDALTLTGQLRIASDRDLDHLRQKARA